MRKTKFSFLLAFSLVGLFYSCSSSVKNSATFIIWTDRQEIVSYTELFNSLQNKIKAVVVYKPRLSNSLPPAKDEEKPDLVIGSWLKNERTRKNFRPLDNLLSPDAVNASTIYAPLLEYGKTAGKQYLLPVSFNLPLVLFAAKNEYLLPDNYSLTLDQIRDTAANFNNKNKNDFYVKMGFAPSWDKEFLYTVTKNFAPCFKEKGTSFIWNDENLLKAVRYIRTWTEEKNTSVTAEQDFQFKYLYTPKYRQVTEERILFAYSTSGEIFNHSFEQIGDIDYRWITINQKTPVEDDIVSMAIYKNSKNPQASQKFIVWFFNENSQKMMLDRTAQMNLASSTFGIASGFSSLRSVNEHFFPTYYRNLLGNLPSEKTLSEPQAFPSRWSSLKERVIYPYLFDALKSNSTTESKELQDLLNAWAKQFD